MSVDLPTLEQLAKLEQKSLKALHQSLYPGAIPPRRTRLATLRPQVAYLLQAKSRRVDIDRCHQTIIDKLSHRNNRNPNIGLGTRLVREWHGESHVVEVEDAGYRYQGNLYRRSSEIARLVTGVRWSGPRFFGLKSKTKG